MKIPLVDDRLEDEILAKIDRDRGFDTEVLGVTSPLRHAKRRPFGLVLELDELTLGLVCDECSALMCEPRPLFEQQIGAAWSKDNKTEAKRVSRQRDRYERKIDQATKAHTVARIMRMKGGRAEISLEGATALYRTLFALAEMPESTLDIAATAIRDEVNRRIK